MKNLEQRNETQQENKEKQREARKILKGRKRRQTKTKAPK